MLPFLSRGQPWFTFIVHLRSVDDAEHFGIGLFLRHYSSSETEYRRKLCSVPPLVSAQMSFRDAAVTGELLCIMRLPEQVAGAEGSRFVHEAAAVAVSRGTRVIGLGGLTAPATGGGLLLCDALPRGVTLTNGNALTAFAVRENVVEASRLLGLGTRARVAVIGCTGSVGGAASRLIAGAGFPLILVGRNRQRVTRAFPDIDGDYAGDMSAVSRADIVVLLTSDPAAVLDPHSLRPGAIVIDCAQPPNVLPRRYAAFGECDVVVVEGALVTIDDYATTRDISVSEPGTTFACLAETYLFARAGIREHSVGRPTVGQALRMATLADRFGIAVAPLERRVVRTTAQEVAS